MSHAGDSTAAVTEWPRRLEVHAPPHVHRGDSVERTYVVYCLATVPIMAAGAWIFGYRVLGLYLAAAVGAVLADRVCRASVRRGARGQFSHAFVMGLLLAMTLPPTTRMSVAFAGGFLGIAVGKWLLGSLGNYVWHPALVGRALVQLAFPGSLTPNRWPVLAHGHNFSGSLDAAQGGPGFRGYGLSEPPPGVEAWETIRPIDWLVNLYSSPFETRDVEHSLLTIIRDKLPPWSDTVWGVVGGGIGETCTIAILMAVLLLLGYRCARWQLPIAAIVTVAILAAVWPLHVDGPPRDVGQMLGGMSASTEPGWFPLFEIRNGFPVGIALLLFHLTGGGLLVACLVIAPEPVTTPLRGSGHFLFGVGLGALAFLGRVWGLSPGSAYWAVLAMNTLVPLIDRVTRRRVFGS